MKITIYIEGGGNSSNLKVELRQSFKKLFENAGFKNMLPKVVASGGRDDAFNDFQIAIGKKIKNEEILLLVDSEDLISENVEKWQFVNRQNKRKKPKNADEENMYFMATAMESWFLADIKGLEKFYGKNFDASKLPKNNNLEKISKEELFKGLKNATKNTTKGEYDKSCHSFQILGSLDAEKIKNHGKYSKEFFEYLDKISQN